jgi:hypothetical protein
VHPIIAQDGHREMKFRAMIRKNRLLNEGPCHHCKASVIKQVDREEVHPTIAQDGNREMKFRAMI